MIRWLKSRISPAVETPSIVVVFMKICLGLWEIAVGLWIILPFDSFSPANIGPWANIIGENAVALLTLMVGLAIVVSTLKNSHRWMKVSLFLSFFWALFVSVVYVISDDHNIFIVSVVAALIVSAWLYLHTSVSETALNADNLLNKK